MTRYFEIRPQLKKYFANEGTFTDPRDGNVYKTIEINGQTWLAENLRYEGVRHYAPNGDKNNIAEYGCLYEWENAMKACPDGWHLPSKEEFKELILKHPDLGLIGYDGDELISKFHTVDAGYSVVFKNNREYFYLDYLSMIWSGTKDEKNNLWALHLGLGSTTLEYGNYDSYMAQGSAYSLRCIKD